VPGVNTKIGFTVFPDRDEDVERMDSDRREQLKNNLIKNLKDNTDPLKVPNKRRGGK
jgi:hypothetical protein